MDYREKIVHGNEELPIALYHVDRTHIRYRMVPHWHPEHEILYVESGELRLSLDHTEHELRAGDVAFISGGTIHSAEPTDCRYHCYLVNLPLLMKRSDACMERAEQLQNGTLRILPLPGRETDLLAPLCREINELDRRHDDGYPFSLKGAIFHFFGIVLGQALVTQGDTASAEATAGRMKLAMTYMEEHYASELRLSELAALADMTPNYFCHCFKQAVGQSPFEYLIRYRLAKAQYALRTTDRSVTEIALGSGFGDVSYFIRLFRERFGMTPKRYRNTAQEQKPQ